MSADDRPEDESFQERRREIRDRLDRLPGATAGTIAERSAWFEDVYRGAGGDAAAIPWADLKPKDILVNWLKKNPGAGDRALDIACGLGDNAAALAGAGYRTTAFDIAESAINWAKERFPEAGIDFCTGDLFALPPDWIGAFDLVHECYTLQTFTGEMRDQAFAAVMNLVRPGGRLVVIARSRDEHQPVDGPPWPLQPSEFARFEDAGLEKLSARTYVVERPDCIIPHRFLVFRKPD
ncbi:MAG: class I SAM-dependent methyltransferase [Hyphomicrobiales bacterium]|nr:class I SAM-dependent methyltransferase [Hyphomicrobiales bacterium]